MLHHDLCPDNLFFIGDDVRLFDFEMTRFGHAPIDASYGRILFSYLLVLQLPFLKLVVE
ncbi:MAG: hypothetical protein R3E79_59350 [Caldilineaceae bacterium]